MSVLVIGAKGNMGRRYSAILDHLMMFHEGVDVDTPESEVADKIAAADRFIIATPTDTHRGWVERLAPESCPILCEKPLARSYEDARAMYAVCRDYGATLDMVLQYRYLTDSAFAGPSHYNYWNHGRDGLVWDCIQIVALSKTRPNLAQDSPIWSCQINGFRLHAGEVMDEAYVRMIQDWMVATCPIVDSALVLEAHRRAEKMAKDYGSNH